MDKALKSVFAQGRQCDQLRTDKGTEYLNRYVSRYLKEKGIKHFEIQNQPKSKQTHKWVNVLGEITRSYNADSGEHHRQRRGVSV